MNANQCLIRDRDVLQPALNFGLLVSDGELWQKHRKAFAFIAYDDFKVVLCVQ